MMASSFFKSKENLVIDFLRSPKFSEIIKDVITDHMENVCKNVLDSHNKISNQISTLAEKLETVKTDLEVLKQVNQDLTKKILENESEIEIDSSTTSSAETNFNYDDKENQVSENRTVGIVRWFNLKDGYGFITVKGTDQEVFVHKSAIAKKNPNKPEHSLKNGETVEFIIKRTEKGNEARNVTGPEGKPVEGSSYDTGHIRRKRGGKKRAEFENKSNQNVNQSKDSDNESRSSQVSSRCSSKQAYRNRKKKHVNRQETLISETHRHPAPFLPFHRPPGYHTPFSPPRGSYGH